MREEVIRFSINMSIKHGRLLEKIASETNYKTQRAIIERGIELVAKEAGLNAEKE